MQKTNEVILTGTFKTEAVSPTFSKQVIAFDSKTREGTWQEGQFEIYIKPDLVTSSGIQEGDTVKIKGFMVFNFWGEPQKSFAKMIVNEVLEKEAPGADGQPAQPTQPTQPAGIAQPPHPGMAPQPGIPVPPQPGVAPAAPGIPVPPTPIY